MLDPLSTLDSVSTIRKSSALFLAQVLIILIPVWLLTEFAEFGKEAKIHLDAVPKTGIEKAIQTLIESNK